MSIYTRNQTKLFIFSYHFHPPHYPAFNTFGYLISFTVYEVASTVLFDHLFLTAHNKTEITSIGRPPFCRSLTHPAKYA